MQEPLYILGIISKGTVLPPVLEGINTLLNTNGSVTVQLLCPESELKKVETQLAKHKHLGKRFQEGTVGVRGADEKMYFEGVNIPTDSLCWIAKADYLAKATELFKWLENNGETDVVYTLAPSLQKSKLLSRAAFRLFNSARIKGVENGFIACTGEQAQKFLLLKGISTTNFSWKIASYATLSKQKTGIVDVEIPLFPGKISFSASLSNAINNCYKWMVNEPLQDLKTKKYSSLWDVQNSVWRLVFFCLGVLGVVAFPILSFHYGITWDEPGEAEYAKLVLKYYMSFGQDKSCFEMAEDGGYILNYGSLNGPSVNLLCAFVAKYLSPFGLYETRHIIISLIGITGIIYAGRLGKLLGNWQTASIIVLILLFSPHFFGHQFNNQKDAPFAVGYIISLYYLICFLRELPNPSRKTMLFTSLAFGFTIGVRIGGLLLPAYLVMCLGLYWLFMAVKQGIKTAGKYVFPFIKYTVFITIVAYIFGIIFWPFALVSPIENPYNALTLFTKFTGIYNFELFEGKLLFMGDKPWYYLPKYIGIQTPLFILAGIAFFLVLLVPKIKDKNFWFWVLLIFSSAFPVAYAIAQNSNLLNGWRHFLFVYPPLAVLAGLGWQRLAYLFKKPALIASVFILFIINISYAGFWMAKNHPNEYVYFNELVGGTKGAYSYYETDYYSNSLKQAADWFNKNVGTEKPYLISTNNEPTTAGYYINKKNPDAKVIWSQEEELFNNLADYSFITTRTMSHYQMVNGFFPPKNTIHTIKADGIPLVAIVKRDNHYQYRGEYYYDKKQMDSALYYASKAVQADMKDIQALDLLAKSQIALGKYEEAKNTLARSIKLVPDGFKSLELMGQVYFKEKNYEGAYNYFTKSIKQRVNHANAYTNRGVTLFMLQKYPEAITDFENALKYGKSKADYYVYILKCYYSMKKYKEAIETANKVLALEPSNAETYMMLAEIYKALGDETTAGNMYYKYLEYSGQ